MMKYVDANQLIRWVEYFTAGCKQGTTADKVNLVINEVERGASLHDALLLHAPKDPRTTHEVYKKEEAAEE
jgi:hypothetical protein